MTSNTAEQETWTCYTDDYDNMCKYRHGAYALTNIGGSLKMLSTAIYNANTVVAQDDDQATNMTPDLYDASSYKLAQGPYHDWCNQMNEVLVSGYCPEDMS